MKSKTTQDYEKIQDVIHHYVEGTNGDVELLKTAFHANAIINGYPIQELYKIVEYEGKTDAKYYVDFIDIVGPVASTKIIVEDWHGNNYVEYFHLLKTKEGWKITSKTGIGFIE